MATERLIEIIGEAANHVSEKTRQSNEEIEWKKIIGMRNKLAHDYGEILADRVWVIATKKFLNSLKASKTTII